MPKMIAAAAMAAVLFSQAYGSTCPVTLVSGVSDPDALVLTLRNAGKLPIRRLELDCRPTATKGKHASCREENALFYPGTQMTVRYTYPGGVRQTVIVALKSATFSDGYVWKPTKKQPCRVLRVVAGKK
jgi:hypothetical protein